MLDMFSNIRVIFDILDNVKGGFLIVKEYYGKIFSLYWVIR